VSDVEKKTISAADEPTLKAAAIASIVKVPTLMEWRIKAHSHWMLPGDLAFGSVAVMAWCIYLWILLFMDESSIRDSLTRSATALPMFSSFFWWAARKKTVWNYTISSEGGFVEFWEDYFQTTKYFFKGLAVFAIVCVITMIAIAPGLIWAIAGIGGMVILAGIKLMTWENDVSWQRFKWDRPQIIFTDRKRGLVVLERHHNPELPFWENYLYVQVFLPKDQIDDFLALCRKYAPGDVEYKEGHFRE
jgi:hypothetical protein